MRMQVGDQRMGWLQIDTGELADSELSRRGQDVEALGAACSSEFAPELEKLLALLKLIGQFGGTHNTSIHRALNGDLDQLIAKVHRAIYGR